MRFRVVGYGTGSMNGSGMAKQYRTLRGEIDLALTKYATSEGIGGLGLSLRGRTRKASDASGDNEVAVDLTNMTLTEIADLANYLCCLIGKRREMLSKHVDEDSKREFPIYRDDELDAERNAVLASLDRLTRNVEQVRALCTRDLSNPVDERGRRIS